MVDAARESATLPELPRARRSATRAGHGLPGPDEFGPRPFTGPDSEVAAHHDPVTKDPAPPDALMEVPDMSSTDERVEEYDVVQAVQAATADASSELDSMLPLTGTAAFDATGDRTVMPTWDELVREHADRVYRLAYRLSGDAQDAEDLTQETFIRVFRSLSNYQPGTFEGWLHRITTNLFLDMVRRRSRIRMEALPEDYDRVPADGPGPEQVFHDARLDPDLQSALDSLAPEFRAAVVLCDIEGLSYEEIGATLGVKLGTVRSRIHRGRQALREYLAHNGVQERFAAEASFG
ncbi:putative alternative RNA polymerase sigma factor [Nocardia jinanensis]|uniref:Alternative RNA polymerase sigma factor n=3 Tax=Nocardiaceae TaxID=85025 RepID=A0A917VVW8_9NOCA|nr:RNA polymerase sigma factor SigE [Nocardia jinanensis]GGL29631.1 putative alternative RNA polymerase sigma factor [Nocardia jinanensis]